MKTETKHKRDAKWVTILKRERNPNAKPRWEKNKTTTRETLKAAKYEV